MRQSDTSQMFATPFGDQADSSTITTIPQSKTAIGRASMALGFPKETFTPIAAGGVPPYGEDMNGILHMLAQAARAAEAGLVRPFSQNYANSINGYPLGAIVAHPSISGRYVMNTQDNNTAAPPGNGWIDPLSDFVTNEAMNFLLQQEVQRAEAAEGSIQSALQQEVTRAEAAEGSIQSALQQEVTRAEAAEAAILQLPAWVPIPCPLTTAPTGFLPADGRSFNTSQYPQLAVGYPNGVLPDLRGMFLRGLDTTGAVDNVPGGRQILSFEDGSLVCLGDNNSGNLSTFTGLGGSSVNTVLANYGYDLQLSNGVKSPLTAWVSNTTNYAGAEPVGITRPRNIAFNYIFRAA